MERKLAHIEKIDWIKPIKGADKIELCGILGWQCVIAKKDNFKVGDKVIYCEVDSVMPDKPEFEFLRDKKFRVKTIKLRGEISQGLVLPLTALTKIGITIHSYSIGDDLTEKLGITKYLTQSEQFELQQQKDKIKLEKSKLKKFLMRYSWFRKLFLSNKQKSGFPYWVSKTDEERVQNIPQVLEQFKNEIVYITEKIDYQSGTWTSKSIPKFNGLLGRIFPLKKVLFVVASRNLTTNDKNSLYWQIAKKYNLESICQKYPGIIIQGEQGNSKVQGNKYELKEPKMWVFNIIMPNGNFLNPIEIEEFCLKHNLESVPLLEKIPLNRLGNTVDDVINYSKGTSKINPKIQREGVVVRCIKDGKKILSFKAINPNFLLKYD